MLLNDIFEKVELENARSRQKHGPWQGTTDQYQRTAIRGEFREWHVASFAGQVEGEHGEIEEAIDTINVLCRRIMFLTGEVDA